MGDCEVLEALHEKVSCRTSSLCNLCVLCVSVVSFAANSVNHRDTENTEVAQRRVILSNTGQAQAPKATRAAYARDPDPAPVDLEESDR